MKRVTLIFVIPDEEEERMDLDIRNTQLLNDWPCWEWSVQDADDQQKDWYEQYERAEV